MFKCSHGKNMNKHTHTKKMSYYTQPLHTLTIEIIVDELKASAIDGNHRINTFFTMEMVIYRYIEIIGELLLPPIFYITYMMIKNIIQVNQYIYIYNN